MFSCFANIFFIEELALQIAYPDGGRRWYWLNGVGSRAIDTLCPLHAHQAPADHKQVRQRTRDKQAMRYLL